MTIDPLKEMPQITGEIGLGAADLPSMLCKVFDRISMSVYGVLLRQSAQLHDPSKHGATQRYIPRTLSCEPPLLLANQPPRAEDENHEARGHRLSAVLDLHCSTNWEGSDADLAEQIAHRNAGDLWSLAADKGYDKQSLHESLRNFGIRPLIKHRIFYDHVHNARINKQHYNQCSMTETVNSAVKRSHGEAERARFGSVSSEKSR